MQEAYPIMIFFAIVGGVMGAIYTYIHLKEKSKNPYFLISALLWFLMTCLLVAGMWLNSEKLILSGFIFPIILFMIVTSTELLKRYKNCDTSVIARCDGFREFRAVRGIRYRYAPKFSYEYMGVAIVTDSFESYSRRSFKKLFCEGHNYEVFINPQNPAQCVDKRRSPVGTVLLLIFSMIFLIFGIVVVVLI